MKHAGQRLNKYSFFVSQIMDIKACAFWHCNVFSKASLYFNSNALIVCAKLYSSIKAVIAVMTMQLNV